MTDRVRGFVVTLKDDIREDAVQPTVDAIAHIKGVLSVDPVIGNVNDSITGMRLRNEIVDKLVAFTREFSRGS